MKCKKNKWIFFNSNIKLKNIVVDLINSQQDNLLTKIIKGRVSELEESAKVFSLKYTQKNRNTLRKKELLKMDNILRILNFH